MKINKSLVIGIMAAAAALAPVKNAEAHHGFHHHHHYSAWGRGGRHFWPAFTGGLIGGALWGYRPYYYATPVVYTTPVVTTTYAATPVATTVQQTQPVQTTTQAPVQQAPVQAQPSTLVMPNGTKITTSDPAIVQQYMQMMQNQQQNTKQ